jgi:hypothetical protein
MRLLRLGWIVVLGAFLLSFGAPRVARAMTAPSRVSVMTMGPGEHPFTRFGHNAILLEWDGEGPRRNAVYNFGTFAFDGVQGIADFMAGRFRYWLSVGTLESALRSYGAAQRSLTVQELRLTPAERATLAEKLASNARPEHRFYDYDYYRDNCSTRVRDALDELLGGQLAQSVKGSGSLTFRQHTLRLLGDAPLIYAGLDVALGAATDQPTTRWEELFLPQELHDALAHATRQLDGQEVPLVVSERQLLSSRYPLPPRQPPARRAWFAALGVSLGLVFAALGSAARTRPALRVAFGLWSALCGAVLGLLGCVFAWFWLFSKHWAAYQNHALLGCPPWALALAVLGIAVAMNRRHAPRYLRRVVASGALASGALLLLALPAAGREGLRLALFFVPLWSGWLFGARVLAGSSQGGARRRATG